MNGIASSTGRWAVSARPGGEVLVTRVDAGEISVVRFGSGLPAGPEGMRQLNDLIEASREAAKQTSPQGPIPALLHQALARLLALETQASGGALIVFDDGQLATVATIGDVSAQLQLDGMEARLPWVRVRDRSGHEARAYPIPADGHSVFSLQWPKNREPGASGIEIDACWPVTIVEASREAALANAPSPVSSEPVAQEASYADSNSTSGDDGAQEKEGFLQWFDRMRGRRAQGAEEADGAISERIPPSPEPEWLTGAAVSSPEDEPAREEWKTSASRPLIDRLRAADPSTISAAAPSSPWGDVAPVRPFEDAPAHQESAAHEAPVTSQSTDERRTPTAPRRLAWPEPERIDEPMWKKQWAWGTAVIVLLCGAVWVTSTAQRASSPARSLVAPFGPRFTVTINSRPPGAWIAIDGKDTGWQTPSTLEVPPGKHQVMLTIADRGSATVPFEGERNQRTSIDAALYGAVRISSTDPKVPVTITLDGLERGYAPLLLEDLLPGPHEIRFRAPGMDPWAETFELRIGETHDIVARPFTVPDKGVIEVRATLATDGTSETLKGAVVYIDGESRGTTPAKIELTHGPHSIRLAYKGEDLPVQVIDLPGGNHLFADFAFGSGKDSPRMIQTSSVGPFSREQPAVVSSAITGIAESDLREMWLHVRSPDRTWKRYEMTLLRADGGVVGVAVFPLAMIDADGGAVYYTSAVMQVGDEYFTELRTGRKESRVVRAPRAARAARVTPEPEVVPSGMPAAGAETP